MMLHIVDLHKNPKYKPSNSDPHESWLRFFLTGALSQPCLLKNTAGFKLKERSHQSQVAFNFTIKIILGGHSSNVSQPRI